MRNLLAGFFLLAACQGGVSPSPVPSASALPTAMAALASPSTALATGSLAIAHRHIPVDIADTVETRRQGLSGRPSLAPDTGLVLAWDQPAVVAIWMPDMNFAIDVIFVADSLVTAIYPDAQPCPPGGPCPAFGPQTPQDFVLEVPAGSAKRWGLTEGASAVLTR